MTCGDLTSLARYLSYHLAVTVFRVVDINGDIFILHSKKSGSKVSCALHVPAGMFYTMMVVSNDANQMTSWPVSASKWFLQVRTSSGLYFIYVASSSL